MKSKARTLYEKYPDLFSAMFEHSFDDISVIYSKLMANAMGKAEPYWTPAEVDMAPIYDELRKAAEEAK